MPTEHPRIRGDTHEEKFASTEHILRSLSRRLAGRAVVYVPPVPLFMGFNDTTMIGEVLIPFSGTMKDVFVRVGELHTKTVTVRLEIISDVAETRTYFTLSKRSERLPIELQIHAGALLRVTVTDGSLKDFNAAVAIYPDIDSHQVARQLEEMLVEENGNALQAEKE